MTATDLFEDDILDLIFTNADMNNIGDTTGLGGSTAAGNFYISLHTAAIVDSNSTQNTSEAAYTSYARQAVARTSGGWTISGNNCSNTAAITFPEATGGSNTITYFGIGSAVSGAGNLYMSGALDASLAVSSGITPEFAIGELDVDAD